MSRAGARASAAWVLLWGLPLAAVLAPVGWLAVRPAGLAALGHVLTTQPRLLANSLVVGVSAAAGALLLGWVWAHVQASYRVPGRRVLHLLGLVPLFLPSFTFAMALLLVFGQGGLLARQAGLYLPDLHGPVGLVAAGTLARFPYAYLALLVAYRRIDSHALDAAVLLGASPMRILRRVLSPRLAPALASTFLVLFADTLADLANPLVIGGGFGQLATRLHEAVNAEGDPALAAAYAVLLVVPALAAATASWRIGLPRPSAVDATGPERRLRRPSGPGRLLVAVAWTVGALVAVLLGVVVAGSVLGEGGGPTLQHYVAVWAGPHTRALATTLLLAVLAAPLTVAVALLLTRTAGSSRTWLRRAQRAANAAASVPGIVLGLGAFLLHAALAPLLGVQGSVAAMLAAELAALLVVHVVRGTSGLTLTTLRTAEGLVPQVRDTAATLGVRGWRETWLVDVPHLRPALLAGGLAAFARSLTAVSSVVLLTGVSAPLLSVRIVVEVDAGRLAGASAMMVTLALLVGLAAAVAALVEAAWARPGRQEHR